MTMTSRRPTAAPPPDPDQLGLGVGAPTAALARRGDPATSHAAAKAQTPRKLRAAHRRVLVMFSRYGAMDDRTLRQMANDEQWFISDSGLRTRRAEMVDHDPPLIEDSGRKAEYDGGYKGTIWQLTAKGREVVG